MNQHADYFRAEVTMTLNEALILSYVKRGIGYGYNILTHVRNSRSDEWVEFSRAGLYKTLDKLEKSGLVEKKFEQSGGRPPKKVFHITEAGETALNEFLERDFDFGFQTRNDLDAYIVTAVAASPDSDFLREKIERRMAAVKSHLQILRDEWPEDKNGYPFIVYALYKRRIEILEHELEWLIWLEKLLGGAEKNILQRTWGEAVQ